MSYSLAGRAAVITGANQGLGREIARAYVTNGASVLLCARDQTLLNETRDDLVSRIGPGQTVEVMSCDVTDSDAVGRLAEHAFSLFPQVHILVNNAGVYGPMGCIEDVDWTAWMRAMEINTAGSILPCRAFLPHFKTNRYGKIIQLSGGGATNPLPRITAYAASKAAIARFAESLALEVQEFGIDVNAVAPGALDTRLLDEVLAAGPEAVGKDFYRRMLKVKEEGGTPLSVGAGLAVFLGAAESDGLTGRLISAVWDPWERLPEHREELLQSDIYTLRRIVPKDRGRPWGER